MGKNKYCYMVYIYKKYLKFIFMLICMNFYMQVFWQHRKI